MQEIIDAIERHSVFLILGHEDPDGDCLGSQLALSSFLERQGKVCHLLSNGPFRRPEIMHWASYFTNKLPKADRLDEGSTLLVLLDCSSPNRTGLDLSDFAHFPILIIDHHKSGNGGGNYRYVNPESPSTTLLVQDLIESHSDKMTKEEAEYIFFGFCTDTDFFRHLDDFHKDVFKKIDRLMQLGISPSDFYGRIFSGRSLSSQKHLGKVLHRTESLLEGKLLYTWELEDDFTEENKGERDSGTLYKQLQSIKDGLVIAVAKESRPGELSVSFRSSCNIDVGVVAQSFGGGGHPKASGCSYVGTIDDFRDELLQIFTPLISKV